MTQLVFRRHTERFDANTAEMIEFIGSSALRMETLIRDLLEFSGIADELPAPSQVDAAKCLADAVTNLREAIQASGAEFVVGALPIVYMHEMDLMRIFQNLIGNAVKSKGEGAGVVHIAAERSGPEWVFSIRDNEIGFPQGQAEVIFKAFKRLHGHDYPGSGVGLANCKRNVERYQERIWAESEPGSGATFCFALLEDPAPAPVVR